MKVKGKNEEMRIFEDSEGENERGRREEIRINEGSESERESGWEESRREDMRIKLRPQDTQDRQQCNRVKATSRACAPASVDASVSPSSSVPTVCTPEMDECCDLSSIDA